jgi:2-hydroxy-3-keto-5-methylthiopentenyl-1-phosphate phosphatase
VTTEKKPKKQKELKDILEEKPVWDVDKIYKLFIKRLKDNSIYDKISIGKAKFFIKELYQSYGVEESIELVEYYFKIYDRPNWDHFVRSYEKFYKALQLKKEDDRIRALLRKQAKEWLNR